MKISHNPIRLCWKMTFGYDPIHVAHRTVLKRLVDFVGCFRGFVLFGTDCPILFVLERDFVLIYCCGSAISEKKFMFRENKFIALRGISKLKRLQTIFAIRGQWECWNCGV